MPNAYYPGLKIRKYGSWASKLFIVSSTIFSVIYSFKVGFGTIKNGT